MRFMVYYSVHLLNGILSARPLKTISLIWWGWRHCLAPQLSLLYIIVLNKLITGIWTVCDPGRRGVKGTLKMLAPILIL